MKIDRQGDEIEEVTCPKCKGRGYEDREKGSSSIRGTCSKCGGRRKIWVKKKDRTDAVL